MGAGLVQEMIGIVGVTENEGTKETLSISVSQSPPVGWNTKVLSPALSNTERDREIHNPVETLS